MKLRKENIHLHKKHMKDKNNQHKLKNEKGTDGKIAATSTAKSSYVCYVHKICM